MLFTELTFFFFFAGLFALYWAIPSNKYRIYLLLVASAVFYGAWDWRFLGLIGFVILVVYWAHIRIIGSSSRSVRYWTLTAAVIALLGVLGVFKYFNFFADNAVFLLGSLGIPVSQPLLDIILPVGISFYVFQSIGLAIDTYRGDFRERLRFTDVAFFIAFFPQLVAGPIVRAGDFIPQIDQKKSISALPVNGIIILFVGGFIKKAIIADSIATHVVDPVFAEPGAYSRAALIAGVFAYAVQIYCDFSGYSDMAIAVSRSFGYELPRNFAAPYLSRTITEFWRRWHLSLSFWLRDYLYISLGGNRAGALKTYRNLLLTMILGGIWHGASWNFLIWGYLHGGVLALERVLGWEKLISRSRITMALGAALTFYLVCLSWVFFRSPDLSESLYIASAMLGGPVGGSIGFGYEIWLLFAGLAVVHWTVHRFEVFKTVQTWPTSLVAGAAGVVIALALPFVPTETQPFIYFQF